MYEYSNANVHIHIHTYIRIRIRRCILPFLINTIRIILCMEGRDDKIIINQNIQELVMSGIEIVITFESGRLRALDE